MNRGRATSNRPMRVSCPSCGRSVGVLRRNGRISAHNRTEAGSGIWSGDPQLCPASGEFPTYAPPVVTTNPLGCREASRGYGLPDGGGGGA